MLPLLMFAVGLASMGTPSRSSAQNSIRTDDTDVGPVLLAEPSAIPVSVSAIVSDANPLPSVPEAFEYDRLVRDRHDSGPLDSGLLGESVDYYTGETDFVATDVSLPGSSALPVALGRRYHVTNRAGGVPTGAFGDWDLEVPHVEGIVATGVGWSVPGSYEDSRCTYFGAPPPAVVTTDTPHNGTVTTTVPSTEYSLGFTIVIPGLGRHEMLLRAPGTPAQSTITVDRVTTRELWSVSCVERSPNPVPGQPDEGFVVTTPDGTIYKFIQGFVRAYAPLQRPADTSVPNITATVDRSEIWMLPTLIKDRFGNSVTYTYVPGNAPGIVNLKRIEASDGRHIDVAYDSGHIKTVSDGARTWTYTYGIPSGRLHGVTLPDDSTWTIDFDTLDTTQWGYAGPTCTNLPASTLSSTVTGSIQHPSGATGLFSFKVVRHGRYSTPATCLQNSIGTSFAPVEPAVYDVIALVKKQITGPGLPGAPNVLTWAVDYAGCSSSSTNSCNDTTKTTVTDPRSNKTEYTFGTKYGSGGSGNEGQLLEKKIGASSTSYAQDETYDYFPASGQSYPAVLGTPSESRGDVSAISSLRPVKTRTIKRDGATYTLTMSNLDTYGFPLNVSRIGTDTRNEVLTYAHNTTDWVLGTIKKLHTATPASADDYELTFNTHNQPLTLTQFGRLARTLYYYSDGTLNWIEDAADSGHRTIFSQYQYGIPRSIKYADGSEETATVTFPGRINTHKDVMGHTTSFHYDDMGRIDKITPPAGYNPTILQWHANTTTGWTRTTTVGGAVFTDTYDAFMRPMRSADTLGRNINRTFDSDGNTTFVSQPGSALVGTSYAYDALNRLRTETDELGYQTTYIPAANKITYTNRNNHPTEVLYMAYDEPTTAWPTSIKDTASTFTTIDRDGWGKIKDIHRGAVHRSRTYDTNQRLWTITEPESGTRTFTYYPDGPLKTITHEDGVVETHTYDMRNRLTDIAYSDGSDAIHRTWRFDGLPDTASHSGTTRSWTYDDANVLTGESVSIGGTTYSLGYDHDLNKNVTTITYPDGDAVALLPNDYGQPSKVGAYANTVKYFLNDAIKSFNYGNGIQHSLTQDDRLLPSVVKDTGMQSATWTYDHDGNPHSVSDTIDSTRNRTLTYDNIERLHTAVGPWGTTTFTLDTQDNLTGDTGESLSLAIGATNNLPTGTAFQWDVRGRLKRKGTASTATNYTFDAANLLRSVDRSGTAWSYVYDAEGRRATTTDYEGKTTVYVYSGNGSLMYQATTGLSRAAGEKSIWDNGHTKYAYLGNHLIAKDAINGSGIQTLQYLHTDALGSTIATSNAARQTVSTATYWPYGSRYNYTERLAPDGPGYANQYEDPSGLIYMRARYYDPKLHRFISPDPVDASGAGNFNRYAYANNSPYKYHDPSGRESGCFYTDDGCKGDGGEFAQELIDWGLPPLMAMQPEVGGAIGEAGEAATWMGEAAGELATEAPLAIAEISRGLEAGIEGVEGAARSAEGELTTLYRAIMPAELEDIQATGVIQNLGSAEGKYFTSSAEYAAAYARKAVTGPLGDEAYTLMRTDFPTTILRTIDQIPVDGGIPAWVVPNEYLNGLIPEVLDYMPIPQ